MDVPSLFGDLLLDGVVYWCDWSWRWRESGGGHWSCWDVGLAGGHWRLPGRHKGLRSGNHRLARRRRDPLWRQGRFGRRRSCSRRGGGGCRFGNYGEDSPRSHRRVEGGGGPPLIHVRDAVVMIWRRFAGSRRVNNHLRNG